MQRFEYTVFTKPWTMPLPELGVHIAGMGFDGVELPIRPGYQVTPDHAGEDLPEAVKVLKQHGLSVRSVAAPLDEPTIAACAEAGVPIIRVMAPLKDNENMTAALTRMRGEYEEIAPVLEKHGVKVGVQQHWGRFVANAAGLLHLLQGFDPAHFGVVYDVAHQALCGADDALGLDMIWPYLCMVNLKNAFWRRINGPEAEDVEWDAHWTTGRQGIASWPRVAAELRRCDWSGPLCLTAQYTEEKDLNRLTAQDLAYAKKVFGPQ